ncbi:putative septum site-determining protein MinC [Marinobacterium nitratireducens]|uniref:Probable septum site-determining protein MinC n=1 Tax=Marinobacterium nitratireducens TaxID=518897 RepID=A0A917Z899_9GAMM|nr:septum site-determining protein MinC [Marinobacterium nitratireducens]GGO75637.1 putative septum site-determining protein MinC [Marinobacterium nitratireducens]
MNELCFQLKGTVVTAIVLELYRFSRDEFAAQLADKVRQAPMFFQQTPVVMSLEKLESDAESIDFDALFALCREFGLRPMAIKGAAGELAAELESRGLALLPAGNGGRAAMPEVKAPAEPAAEPEVVVRTVVEEKLVQRPSKVVTKPVRSGQQVYAEGADLIVLAAVSEGAEILADGHIHVYGALRGRALAGVRGDENARIFCQSLEAELVSVAGNFKLSDALRETVWKAPAQLYLKDDTLFVKPL